MRARDSVLTRQSIQVFQLMGADKELLNNEGHTARQIDAQRYGV